MCELFYFSADVAVACNFSNSDCGLWSVGCLNLRWKSNTLGRQQTIERERGEGVEFRKLYHALQSIYTDFTICCDSSFAEVSIMCGAASRNAIFFSIRSIHQWANIFELSFARALFFFFFRCGYKSTICARFDVIYKAFSYWIYICENVIKP